MITKCKYDKNRDFKQVVPNLSMSIRLAMQTGVITDSAANSPYNEMESTEQVGNYLHDTIDIAMASKKLGIQMSSNPTSTDVSTPTE